MDPFTVLFVCTGNICRSPMAEVYFRSLCVQNGRENRIDVDSAGMSAVTGYGASEFACGLVESEGLSLAEFRSKRLERTLAEHAGLIVCMTKMHKTYVETAFPECQTKTFTLLHFIGSDDDIADPYGAPMEAYVQCAAIMKPALQALLEFVEERIDTAS